MKLELAKVLADSEIQAIHEATVEILSHCGVRVQNSKMLEFLKDKGVEVDEDQQIVRFSKGCIEDAISKIPSSFDVYNQTGDFAFTLGDRNPKIAAGHNAVFWVDSNTGQTRYSTVADVEQFARLCDNLEHIDMIGIPVMPQDVPNPRATLLYGIKAVVENSIKPVYFSTDNSKVNNACIQILDAAFEGNLKEQVYGISQLSPTSPLFWEGSVIDAIIDTINAGVPVSILPEPIAGMSAPYTLAGLLTVNNSECISGFVMIQLLKSGSKVMYGNSWTTTDMRSGAALVGSAETTICRIAAAQLARFYKVPSHTTAPNSDNHAHDEQNAWEKTLSQFCSIAAGHDLIVNCGMFATGMTCSHEQLLMDEEISALCKRISRGIRVCDDTIAKDLIQEIGVQGPTYMTTEHTLKWLHSDEYVQTNLSVCGPRASWEAQGSKDTYRIAQEKIKQINNAEKKVINPKKMIKIKEVLSEFNS